MAEPVREITIVGGGTAGWLAAAMLNRYLNRNASAPVRVSLIESGKLPPIGVGEATVPPMRQVLHDVGVDEHEFFRRCNATFKLGVRFTNWDLDARGRSVEYINSLTEGPVVNGRDPGAGFLAFAPEDWTFPRTVLPTDHLVDRARAPRRIGDQPYSATLGYAYHFEAGLFAEFMRDHATAQGVHHVIDDVDHVEMGTDGNVAALHLAEQGRWPVELVIDCTGFKGLIINKAMGEPFESYSDCMLNDRAIVGQVPRGADDPIYPYTGSWALSSGWAWRIPLYSRVSSGYVFSSAHLSDDEARAELLNHWGMDEETFQPRVVPMRVGKTRRTWVNNCVSIGLAAGFIEPLESTGIYMTDRAIRFLIDYFPDQGYDPRLQERYNELMGQVFDEVRDFIVAHYYLSNRDDSPYWRTARHETAVPRTLLDNLDVWRRTLPTSLDLPENRLFSAWTYEHVLFGKGFYTNPNVPESRHVARSDWEHFRAMVENAKTQLAETLPDQRAFLASLRGADAPQDEREAAQRVSADVTT